jgi:hypothetical protein
VHDVLSIRVGNMVKFGRDITCSQNIPCARITKITIERFIVF